MKKLIAITSVLLSMFATVAHADFDIPVSKIVNADYFCGTSEGAYAIKVGKTPRVWQTDLDAKGNAQEGIELKNVKLKTARCPDCFSLSGDLEIMDDALHINGEMRGTSQGIKLDISMYNNQGENQTLPAMECHKVLK